jgi:hypothetical protein
MNLTKEKQIENAIISHLKRRGWEKIPKLKDEIHGVDIKMFHRRWRKYWFIEVKRKYTTKNKKSQTYVNVATAIGQIIYRMHQKQAGFYGIGVPNLPIFKNELRKIPVWIRKKLKLHIFLVDNNGKVTVIPPSKVI